MKPICFSVLLIYVVQVQTFGQIIATVKFSCDIFADSSLTRKTHTLNKLDTVSVNAYFPKPDAYLIIHNTVGGYVHAKNLRNTIDLALMRRNAIQGPSDSINTTSRPKNNVFANFFGASTISLNYERLFFLSPSFFLAGKLGVGYRYEPAWVFIVPAGYHYFTMPFHITANVGARKHYAEFGLGFTRDLNSPPPSSTDYVKTKSCVIVGYRFQPTKSNFDIDHNYFFRFNLQFFMREGYPGVVPIGISVGKSF